uniref:EGF-like domain-containing protein n=1 Tax=Meloidogyne hapla TaxID=6305 RepID=A0A1I8BDX1_MELHA
MDGVCPVDRRRWCYRGACLWEGGQATCLCPPGWLGQQCKEKDEKFDDEMKSIEFNGQNSLLAFSLNSTRDDGEESEDDGFLVEFRLNPTEKSFNQEQLLAVLMRERDEQVLAGVTMQPQNGKYSKWSNIIIHSHISQFLSYTEVFFGIQCQTLNKIIEVNE